MPSPTLTQRPRRRPNPRKLLLPPRFAGAGGLPSILPPPVRAPSPPTEKTFRPAQKLKMLGSSPAQLRASRDAHPALARRPVDFSERRLTLTLRQLSYSTK